MNILQLVKELDNPNYSILIGDKVTFYYTQAKRKDVEAFLSCFAQQNYKALKAEIQFSQNVINLSLKTDIAEPLIIMNIKLRFVNEIKRALVNNTPIYLAFRIDKTEDLPEYSEHIKLPLTPLEIHDYVDGAEQDGFLSM